MKKPPEGGFKLLAEEASINEPSEELHQNPEALYLYRFFG
jgi:hypothetical protein